MGTLPLIALAVPIQNAPNTISSVQILLDKVCLIVNVIFTILLVVVVVFIILAAFSYLTAGGDPEKVKAANQKLIYAAVALVVALIAKGVPAIVTSFFGVGTFTAC